MSCLFAPCGVAASRSSGAAWWPVKPVLNSAARLPFRRVLLPGLSRCQLPGARGHTIDLAIIQIIIWLEKGEVDQLVRITCALVVVKRHLRCRAPGGLGRVRRHEQLDAGACQCSVRWHVSRKDCTAMHCFLSLHALVFAALHTGCGTCGRGGQARWLREAHFGPWV
jgi:hypothetical protein